MTSLQNCITFTSNDVPMYTMRVCVSAHVPAMCPTNLLRLIVVMRGGVCESSSPDVTIMFALFYAFTYTSLSASYHHHNTLSSSLLDAQLAVVVVVAFHSPEQEQVCL